MPRRPRRRFIAIIQISDSESDGEVEIISSGSGPTTTKTTTATPVKRSPILIDISGDTDDEKQEEINDKAQKEPAEQVSEAGDRPNAEVVGNEPNVPQEGSCSSSSVSISNCSNEDPDEVSTEPESDVNSDSDDLKLSESTQSSPRSNASTQIILSPQEKTESIIRPATQSDILRSDSSEESEKTEPTCSSIKSSETNPELDTQIIKTPQDNDESQKPRTPKLDIVCSDNLLKIEFSNCTQMKSPEKNGQENEEQYELPMKLKPDDVHSVGFMESLTEPINSPETCHEKDAQAETIPITSNQESNLEVVEPLDLKLEDHLNNNRESDDFTDLPSKSTGDTAKRDTSGISNQEMDKDTLGMPKIQISSSIIDPGDNIICESKDTEQVLDLSKPKLVDFYFQNLIPGSNPDNANVNEPGHFGIGNEFQFSIGKDAMSKAIKRKQPEPDASEFPALSIPLAEFSMQTSVSSMGVQVSSNPETPGVINETPQPANKIRKRRKKDENLVNHAFNLTIEDCFFNDQTTDKSGSLDALMKPPEVISLSALLKPPEVVSLRKPTPRKKRPTKSKASAATDSVAVARAKDSEGKVVPLKVTNPMESLDPMKASGSATTALSFLPSMCPMT